MEQYDITAQYGHLVQETEKTYDELSNAYKTQTVSYVYGNPAHIYPTLTTMSTTGNQQMVTQTKYAGDFGFTGTTTNPPAAAIVVLNNNNMLGTVIESLQYRQNSDGTNVRYINGMITTYVPATLPTPDSVLTIESVKPLPSIAACYILNGVFNYNSHYQLSGTLKYTDNNLVEQSKANGPVTSYMWDYNELEPVAAVTNASSANIAYTSFENIPTGGNWIFTNVTIDNTMAFAGQYSGMLTTGSKIDKLFRVTPPQSIVSYWASGPATVMSNTTVNVPVSSQGLTTNGWTYYEHLLPVGTYSVELTGNIHIDELRLYPKDAQMQTLTYKPLIGVTSQVSASNQVLRYQYDGLNRLATINDVYGNIKQNFGYNYGPGVSIATPAQTLFYNTATTQNFTKNNCASGTPTSVPYIVPYGRYSAATQAAADALAAQDVTANGQAYANANGQCVFYNDQDYGVSLLKNDCTPDQGLGSLVHYSVPAGSVSSLISVADADAQAQAMVTANGQAYANAHGTCSCAAEGHKEINGTCETGTKIYISSTYSNGQYICVYQYVFSDNTYSQQYTEMSPTNCVNP